MGADRLREHVARSRSGYNTRIAGNSEDVCSPPNHNCRNSSWTLGPEDAPSNKDDLTYSALKLLEDEARISID